ncbi:MAG: hypothetical protein FJW88_15095, partial [Actinobacteria bacterium]|nr:hypothetical protein [Actinomycetota bacterium]
WCRTAGFLYEAHLRAELTGRLGVAWVPVRHGIADLVGVPRRAIEHFSQRRRQITERMGEIGSHGGHAAQVAAYATRQVKDTSVPYADLQAWWMKRAVAVGLSADTMAGVCDRTARRQSALDDIEFDDLALRLDAPNGLTEHRATFDRRDVIRQICAELPVGASTADVLTLADEYLTSRHVVAIVEGEPDRLRRADGRSAPIPGGGPRWTTPDMLRVERLLIRMAAARPLCGAGLANPVAVDAAIARRALSGEQQVMVRRICGSGNGVDVVPGVAGSGKTHALAAAHEAWTASGRTVVGVALSAQAARQLEAGSGIPSMTIARFRGAGDPADASELDPDHVLVVDEAAMVGTRTLVDLVARVHKAGAKAVLVGDACQLPEIEAGGAFAGLSRRGRPAGLSTNRRQHTRWERQALADLRLGHATDALAAYEAHGRIHHDPDPHLTRAGIVDQWWASVADGGDALMLAAHHDAVRDLNSRARDRMAAADQLGGEVIELGGSSYAVGDRVLGLVNDYRTGILNGTRATVSAIDERRRELRLHTTDDRDIRVPFAYVEAGRLAHGYAMTIHKAQGATCDHALVLVDESMSREAVYTAMSRGRQRNDLYLAIDAGRDDIAHAPEIEPDPLGVLSASIQRSAAQQMAIDSRGRG